MDKPVLTHERLQPLVIERWLNAQRHPTLPLTIYNYTAQAQFARHWTPEVLACRGLILDDDDRIVARPFPKFFNQEEVTEPLPSTPFDVYDKLDGSLFIVAWYDGHLVTATRGSFTSPQAEMGRVILDEIDPARWFAPSITYCFELIHPDNRIVVDYGDRCDLVLIGMIDSASGANLMRRPHLIEMPFPVNCPLTRDEADAILNDPNRQTNREGFVYHWPQENVRVKVKFDEYKRLHKLLTGINAVHIWDALRANNITPLLDRVPDEFYAWVDETAGELRGRFDEARRVCVDDYYRIVARVGNEDRRAFAELATKTANPSVMFALLDGKDPAPLLWKGLRPVASRPFRCGEEAA